MLAGIFLAEKLFSAKIFLARKIGEFSLGEKKIGLKKYWQEIFLAEITQVFQIMLNLKCMRPKRNLTLAYA